MFPDGGGGGLIQATPEEVGQAGQRFADGQSRLDAAGTALWQVLVGSAGMAGGDDAGERFAARFDPAVRGLLTLFEGGVRAFGGISKGLVATARN